MALLFADKNFPGPTVEALRQLGHDVLTVAEAGPAGLGIRDEDVLAFAHGGRRAVLRHKVETDAASEPAAGLYSVRTRKFDLKPRDYGLAEVRAARLKLKVSQALLAKVIGVNTQTVSYWEQGRRKVPPMARRYLDDLIDFPALWAARTGAAVEAK